MSNSLHPKLSKRIALIKPSPTMAVTKLAAELRAEGKNVIGLGAGEPDFDTPEHIKKAGIDSIKQGKTKYTAVDGTPDLKQAVLKKFQKDNNLNFNSEEIIISAGGKQVLFNVLLCSLDPDDEVIIPSPYWVSYPDMVTLAGGKPVIVDGKQVNGFKVLSEQIEGLITNKTKWLIINSPSNPTGATYSKEELITIGEMLLKYEQVGVISDDIYEKIIYDNNKFYNISALVPNLKSRTITVNGVSKAYAMTGWRIGYAGGPKEIIKAMAKLQSQSTSNPSSISQAAALEALEASDDFLIKRNEQFKIRRDMVVSNLNECKGISCDLPTGAFYVFPSFSGLIGKKTPTGKIISNAIEFSSYLLENKGVAVVPGSAFGAEGFFRISYATSDKILEEACNRIKDACSLLG